MKSAVLIPRADVVLAMTLPLCAAALLLGAASVVRAAPRSDMVTPGFKPCVQRQAGARTAPVDAPAVVEEIR